MSAKIPRGRLNAGRGEWSAVYRRRMASVNSDLRLSDFAIRLLNWLVFEVDPSCGCLSDVSIGDLAELFDKDWHTVRAALGSLEHHGYVEFEFGRGKAGWVAVTGYYGDVMHPNKLLSKQWSQGAPKRRRLRQTDLKVVR
jgi:DNA-binding transcriptional ArsR family regulator